MIHKNIKTQEEFNTLVSSVVEYEKSRINLRDTSLLRQQVAGRLAEGSLDGNDKIKKLCCDVADDLCSVLAIPYFDADIFLRCLSRDEIKDVTILILDMSYIPFEMLELVMSSCIEMEVGSILFQINPNLPEYREILCQLKCCAIKQDWRSPIMVYDGQSSFLQDYYLLDWKKILYDNRANLMDEALNELLGPIKKIPFDDVSDDLWKDLYHRPENLWQDIWGDMSDYFYDLFEGLDVNETMMLLKKYLIPSINPTKMKFDLTNVKAG